jgi:hypothetical protein
MLTLHATGEFVELRPVTSKEFGQSHKPDDIIGAYAMPERDYVGSSPPSHGSPVPFV